MRRFPSFLSWCAALACIAIDPAAADGPAEISLLAGPSTYDLLGTGTGFEADAGVSLRPLDRILVLEPTLGFFQYETSGGDWSRWLLFELSVQAEGRLGSRVRPYAGGGLGGGVEWRAGRTATDLTLHATGGARIDLSDSWAARAEMRVRAIDPWTATTAFFGFGGGWRF